MSDPELILERETGPALAIAPRPPTTPYTASAEQAVHKTRRLWTWLMEQGATVPAMELAEIDGLRGMRATQPVKEGALVIHVPRRLMITTETAKASWTGKVLAAMGAELSDAGLIAAYLMEIKREGGFWKPYIEALPESFPNLPFFFSAEELEYLHGSSTLRTITDRREWMESDYEKAAACFPPVLRFSREEFAWARCCVSSRTYRVWIPGVGRSKAMVPGADMLNHSNTPSTHYVREVANGFTITAAHNIAAGAQALESYGWRSNGDLLATYGFCLDDNPYDDAQVDLAPLPTEHPFHAQAQALGTPRGDRREFGLAWTFHVEAMSSLFSFLRLGCMRDAPGLHAAVARATPATAIPPVSRGNEVGALRMLAEACQRALRGYRTTIEQDDDLLAGPPLPIRLRNAVVARRGEKVVLKRYLALTEEAIPLLLDNACDLSSHKSADPRMAPYFAHLVKHLQCSAPAQAG